jgi:glycosyltransferase 2 family protein
MLKKSYFIFIIKLFISVALIYYIYHTIPWSNVSKALLSTSLDLLILSVFLQVISFIFLSLRWSIIVRNSDSSLDIYEIIKISFIGIAFNNILPSSIGGDFVRGAYIVKKGLSLKNSILSLIADRVLGLFTVLVFIFIFLLFYRDKHDNLPEINIIIVFFMMSILLGILIFKTRFFNKIIRGILVRILSTSYYEKTVSMVDNLYHYSINKNLVIKVFLMTFIAMAIEVSVFWLASKALGMNYSFYIFIIAVPLIVIISALPISLGGLLVREASGLFLLNMLGVEMLHASSIVILFIPIILISSLPGAYYYWKKTEKIVG